MFRVLTAFVLFTFVTGCASTQMTRLRQAQAKAPFCDIEVVNIPPQDRAFEEVCIIEARGSQMLFDGKSVQSLIGEMKSQACECGADAMVIKNSRAGGLNLFWFADRPEASAVGIRYLANRDGKKARAVASE